MLYKKFTLLLLLTYFCFTSIVGFGQNANYQAFVILNTGSANGMPILNGGETNIRKGGGFEATGANQLSSIGACYDSNFTNNYSAIFTVDNPINITIEPLTPAAFCSGTNVSLTAAANGADAYIWQEEISAGNWTNISGGSMNIAGETVSLTLTTLTTTKKVRCLFTNYGGINTVPTSEVTLVPVQTSITIQPVEAIDCYQNVVRFYVGASDVSYQWQRKRAIDADFINLTDTDITDVSNTSTNYLRVAQAGSANNLNGTLYRCKVTSLSSPFCVNTSNSAPIFVNRFNTTNVTKSPLCVGESITFTSNIISGAERLQGYQWYKTNISASISGANASTFTTTIASTSDNNWGVQGTFQANNTSSSGITSAKTCATSQNRSITIRALPTAPTANDVSRCDAGTVMLSATSMLLANESFRWYETNFSTTILGTGTNFTTTSLAVGTHTYYLSVYNSSTTCESTRTPVIVTVNALPTITLSAVDAICPQSTSFILPFTAITGSPNQFSISTGIPEMSGFASVTDESFNASPISITLPTSAIPNDYGFLFSIKNSITGCASIPQHVNLGYLTPTSVITHYVSSLTKCEGESVSFAVRGYGAGAVNYMWKKNGMPIVTNSRITIDNSVLPSSILTINNLIGSDADSYTCEVSSTCGSVNSLAAALVVNPRATFSTHPSNVVICKGASTTMNVVANGTGTLVFRWKKGSTVLSENTTFSGTASNVLQINNAQLTDAGTYICEVKGECDADFVVSNSAVLVVNDLPLTPIVISPIVYCINTTASALLAKLNPEESTSNVLLWYGTDATGGTSSETAPTPLTTSVGTTSYYVSQKDANNCESPRTAIEVEITPSVSTTIAGINAFCITGVLNSSTNLTANPTGGNGLYTYQWQNLAGNIVSTNQTYEVNSTQTGNSDAYKVTVTSGNCTATANLTVTKQGWNDEPSVSVSPLGDICGGGSKTLSVISPSVFRDYKWFTDASTLIQTAAGESFLTPNLTSTTTYYVAREQKITENLTCQTNRKAVEIIVNVIPETPIIVNSANKTTFCNNESGFSLSISCASGNGQYRLNSGSWTNINTVTITPSAYTALSTLNYDFKCVSSATCESGFASTSITINPVPNAPIISGNTSICSGSSTTLTASGCSGIVVWSNGVSDNSIIISSAGTYNATCIVNNCESLASAIQTVVVNPIPAAPTVLSDDADNVVCAGTSVKLSVSDCSGTVIWSNGLSGTSITISSSGNYNAICSLNGCSSVASLTQTIVVNQNPTITLSSVNNICNATTTFDLLYTTITNSPDKYSLSSTMPDFVNVTETNLALSPINVTIPSGKTGIHSFTINIKNSTTSCINSQTFNLTVLPVLLGGSIEVSSSTINCDGYNPGGISNVTSPSGGTPDYVYQWQLSTDNLNFTDVVGANLTSFNPPSITQTTYYRRKVTDACGEETYSSNVHQVQIVADPQIILTDASERVICSGESINFGATVLGGSGTCIATWQSSNTSSGTYTNEQVNGLSFVKTLTNTSSTPLVKYYRVNYACSGTGSSACSKPISPSVKVTVNYIPNAPIISGSTNICAGNSTTLTASGCTGIITWSNSATGSAISVSASGTYSATCTENSCTSLSSNIHDLTVNPIPNAPIIVSDDADNIICEGTNVVLTANDCTGTTIWSNGTTATSITVSSGTYYATCTMNGCVSLASETQIILANPIPTAPIITGSTSICSGNFTILTASGCLGIVTWNTGVTGSTLSISSSGTYNATCTENGCVSNVSSTQTIILNQIPAAPTLSGNSSICVGKSTILTANGCLGIISWNTGVTGSFLSVSSVGTYTATCTENSCVSLASSVQEIIENALPEITLSSIETVCNSSTSFDLAYTAITSSTDKYSLTSTMPDFVSVSETDLPNSPIRIIIPSRKTGSYIFNLAIKNSVTACVNNQTFNVTILPILSGGSIEVSPSVINCAGYNSGVISSVSLASGGKGIYVYQWQVSTDNLNFTDISGATGTTYNPAGLSETTYYRRKVSDECGTEAYSANIHQIQIVPDPAINISSDKTSVCSGETINFSQTILQLGTCMTTWKSSSSASMTSSITEGTGSELLLNLTNSGTIITKRYFQATYDCSVASCNNALSNVIEIGIKPNPSIPTVSGGGTICLGSSTTLIASGCNGNILWSNGATSTSINVSSAGSYGAVCTNSCRTSATSNEIVVNVITVNPPTVLGTTTICSGQSATLSATGCMGEVVWSNASSGRSISVSPSTTTSYSAICKDNACTSESSESVTITVAPSIDFMVGSVVDLCNSATSFVLPYNITLGSPDQYSLTSTMVGFASISDANLGTAPIMVTIPASQTGTFSFTFTLKISSTGCSKSQTFNVTILPILLGGSIEVSPSTINCAGYNSGVISSVSLASGGKGIYVYQWEVSTDNLNFTDISGASGTTYNLAGLSQTTYYRRKVIDECGVEAYSSNIHQITIVPDPVINIASDKTSVCSGETINFSQTVLQAGAGTCTTIWKSSSSISMTSSTTEGTGSELLLNLSNVGTSVTKRYFQATYDCSVASCNNALSNVIEVSINPNPSIPTVSGGGTICLGSSTTLTASGCSGNVLWSNGATSTGINVLSLAGSYSAVCTNSCRTSATSNEIVVNVITVNPPTVLGTTTICSGQSATLSATGCMGEVVWSNASSGTSISVSPSTTTSYTATCSESGCTSESSESVTITVAPSIDFTVGSVVDLCNSATSFLLPYNVTLGSPDQYSLTSTMASFASISDANLGTSPIMVTIPASQTGTFSFTLTLKISSIGCGVSQTFNVTVLPILLGGSIEVSPNAINCVGYNSGVISSVSLASGGKGIYVYQWEVSTDNLNFTDISGATGISYDPAGLSQTTYYRRKVIDECGAEANSTNIHQIHIVPDPAISILSDKTTVCNGETVNFSQTVLQSGTGTCTTIWKSSSSVSMTSSITEGTGSELLLNLSNVGTSVTKRYFQATYDCSVASCNNALSNVIEIIINPNPSIPTVSGGGTICLGSSTTLTASGCNGNVLWSNGATSTDISVSATGSYGAVCTNSCRTSATSNEIVVNVITVNPPAVLGTTTICSGQSATLSATGCMGEVVWSNASSGTSISVSPSTTTSYTATCSESGCTSESSELVTITVAPSIDFMVGSVVDLCNSATSFVLPYNITLGSPDQYSLTSTMVGFASISDANLGILPILVTIPSGQAGTFSFTLTLKISSTGCSKSQTFNVTILPILLGGSIEVSPSTINCAGYNSGVISNVSLANGGKGIYVYQWEVSTDNLNFTDISGATGISYDPAGLSQTTYYRRKVIDECGAEANSTNIHHIQIVPDPAISILSDKTTVCNGETVNFSQTVLQAGAGTCTTIWKSSSSISMTSSTTEGTGSELLLNLINSGTSVTKRYFQATYDCSLASCNNALSNVIEVSINPSPSIPTVSGGGTICLGSSTTLTASGCNGNILWSNGATTTSISVSTAGSYSAVCTNSCGTSATSNEIVVNVITVNPPTVSGTTTICSGQSATLSATGCVGEVVWSNASNGTSISFSPSTTTSYTATCNESGCTSESSESVTIIVAPSIDFMVGSVADLCNSATSFVLPYNITLGSPDQYSLTSTMANFTSISDADLGTLPILVTIPSGQMGTFSFTLTLKISSTGCSVSQTFNVTVLPILSGGSIEVSPNAINCAGYNSGVISSVSLASGGKGIYIYQWQSSSDGLDFTDILGAIGISYNPAGLSETTYYRRKVIDECGTEAYSSNIHQIQIVPDPVINISSNKATVCSGEAINFSQTVLQAGTGTCTTIWKSSSSASMTSSTIEGTGSELVLNLSNSGTGIVKRYFQATYDCSVASCNNALSNVIEIIINPNPSIPTVSGGGTICSGSITTLTASGCNGNVLWSNGATSTSINVSSAGSYGAVCTNSCGTSAVSNEIVVNVTSVDPPTLLGTTTICSGQSATLSATGCMGEVVWSNASSGTSISVSPSTTISYTATCSESGCTSESSESVTITVAPSIDFTVGSVVDLCNSATSFLLPYNVTFGSPDQYSLTSTMASFASISDANLGILPILVTIPSGQAGTFSFTLTLKISSTGCSKSQTFNVTILPILLGGSIEVSPSTINCAGYNSGVISNVSLANGGKGIYVYQWEVSTDNLNFTDISGATGISYDPAGLSQTTYYRRKVIDECGAEANSTNIHHIQIVPDPAISILSDKTTVCNGETVNFSQTVLQAGAGTCTTIWKSSSSISMTSSTTEGTGSELLLNLINSGTSVTKRYFQATYDCSVASCNNALSNVIEISIKPNPSIPTVSGGGTICLGSSTSLIASACNGNVLWSNGATSTNINVSVAGNYSAVCTNSCRTSAASNEVVVNVITVNPPTVSGTTTICSGQSATLSATGCIMGEVVWSNASSGTNISVSPSTTTSYSAICKDNACTSESSESVTITVVPSIDFTVGSVVDLCNSATSFALPYNVTLGSPDQYSLTSTMLGFGSISDANLGILPISVTIPAGQTGTFSFTLTLKISSIGCSVSKTFNITVLPILSGGSIEVSPSTINCAGYNSGVISSVSLASGGKGMYIYQWQGSNDGLDFTDISGASGTTYNPAGLSETTYYRRKVTDECGVEAYSSNIHQIQIIPDPVINISSDKASVCSGEVINFSQTILQSGSGTCTTTWKSSNSVSMTSSITEGTGSELLLNLSNVGTSVTKRYFQATYDCSVASCNNALSNVIEVSINPNPSIPMVSGGGTICLGSSTSLIASGCNGNVLWSNGATSTSINVSSAGSYGAVCTLNNCTSDESNIVIVTLESGGTPVSPPIITATATICAGQSTNLTATSCVGIVTWSNGNTGTLISVNPTISTNYTANCFNGICTSNDSNPITITVTNYPNITTQPKNEADCDGNSVTFSVAATSVTNYQWQRKIPNGNFTDISNAISNTLTINNVGSEIDPNQTEYRVVLSNGNCSVISTVAILTVNSVVGSLADQTICNGENVSFDLTNITVAGIIRGYQWQRRVGTSGTWNDITGATSTTLVINAAIIDADEQYYRCKVTFTAGNSTCARYTTEDDSNGAKLTILSASTPIITGENAICLGKNTTLTANNCNGIIAWSSGQSTATIRVSPITNTLYTVSCTSTQCGFNVTSAPYLVTVNTTPQPEIITYDVVTPATLTFAARITVPATLMWYNRAAGGTGTTIAPSFSAVGTYSYWVTQIDSITGCESARLPIIAKVLDYFHITQQPTNQVDCKGSSVYFGVVAVGPNPAFTYQWQRKRPNDPDFVDLVEEGNGIKGWFAPTMVVSNVGDVDNPHFSQYRCIIKNGNQYLTSEISILSVNSLTGLLPNLGICIGGKNEYNLQNYFSITGHVMSYQWQTRPGTSGAWTNLNDENGILGSNTSILKFTNATYEQGVYYRCLVKFNTQGFECTEPTDASKLIVSGFPPAPSASDIFYCQNSDAVRLKVNSPIQNLIWYSQETGVAGNSTAPTPNTSIVGIFKYYVSDRTDEGCESPKAVINVEVGALPLPPKNTTLSSTTEGDLLTFSAEGTPSETKVLRWYTSPTTSTFSTTAPTFTAVGTYSRYVAQVSAFGCVSPRTLISATIIPKLKFTKQPISQADCDGNSVTFSVTAAAPSTFSYQWQRQKPDETFFTNLENESSNLLKISDIGNSESPNSTKFRCLIKDEKGTVVSGEAILTVNQIIGKLPTMSICDGKPSKISFANLATTGIVAKYQWQKKVGSAYTDIPTTVDGAVIINEIGTYRGRIVFVIDKNSTCIRSTSDFKVEEKPTPIAPQVFNQTACQNVFIDITKNVTATNSLLWYESMTDSTADKTTPTIDRNKLGKTTYFVSQTTPFGCESERKSFEIMVAPTPEKPATNDLTYCRNARSTTLSVATLAQNEAVWYASLTAKEAFTNTPTPDTKTDGETIYFVSAKNTVGCESERVPLKVSIAPCIATFNNSFNNCLQISADSVRGSKWYDLYDSSGQLYASVNPNGLNLGKVSISIRHYGRGSAAIPATKNDTKLMARYVDFQSSLLNEFNTPVSLRIYYQNEELDEYKTATDLPNLTINDFNILHYDGIQEDCEFGNNDNFVEGDSYVIFKDVIGNQITKDFFYLQFDVNGFSENGATANDFTEITFSGEETKNQTIQLNWQSKFEVKAEKYILERSADGENFVAIGEVKANGSNGIYESLDLQPLAGKSYYRLVYIDKDGTKKYLDAIEINFTDTTPICIIFPNPLIKGDEINLYLRNIKEKEINLYDMLGKTFSFSMTKEDSKIIKIRPDVYLSKGIHFLVVEGEDGKKCVQKVVINP